MKNYDVIIVGAGPAGAMAAWEASERGLKTLLIERGKKPGQKGGGYGGGGVLPKYLGSNEKWMYEGPYAYEGTNIPFWLFNNEGTEVTRIFHGPWGNRPPGPMLHVFKDKWDPWVAQLAIDAGANLKSSTLVRDLVRDSKGAVKGVIIDKGERILAPIVIGCDGVHSTVGWRAGLRPRKFPPEVVLNGIMLHFRMDSSELKKRFYDFFGEWTGFWGMTPGKFSKLPFSNPNKYPCIHLWGFPFPPDQIYIGVVNTMSSQLMNPNKILAEALKIPYFKTLLQGAKLSHYTVTGPGLSFQTPAWSVDLYTDGCMLCGAAAGMVDPMMTVGTPFAYNSGRVAAEVAAEAISSDDYSKKSLSVYERKCKEHPVFSGLKPEVKDVSKLLFNADVHGELGGLIFDVLTSPATQGERVMSALVKALPWLASAGPTLSLMIKPLLEAFGPLLGIDTD